MYRASEVPNAQNRFVRGGVLAANPSFDLGGGSVVGRGRSREPPTVMQPSVVEKCIVFSMGGGVFL